MLKHLTKTPVALLMALLALGSFGCSSNQEVKDVWKDTKGFWYRNVSAPATIDYDDKGDMEKYEILLARSMMGIDKELTNLEKLMTNADKPPTNEWIRGLFSRFPWLNGFAGIRADGSMLGQVPGPSMKPIDFLPLLAEDSKQNLRALRAIAQDTPMGPEVFLATPLYDSQNFLGVVSVYFDMRSLLQYSETPEELIILAPQAVLWAGKYDFGTTPMAGIAWNNVVLEDSNGTVSNGNGTFYFTVRYFGNLPLIFGVPVHGSFGEKENSHTGSTHEASFLAAEPVAAPDLSDVQMPEAPAQTAPEPAVAEPQPAQAPAPAQRQQRARTPMPIYEPAPEPMEPIDPVVTPSPIHDPAPDPVVAPSPIHDPAPDPVEAPSPIHESAADPVIAPSPIHDAAPDSDKASSDTSSDTNTESQPAATPEESATGASDNASETTAPEESAPSENSGETPASTDNSGS